MLYYLVWCYLVLLSCLVLSCPVLSSIVLSLSCLVLSCLVLSCLVLCCLVLSCLVLFGLVLSCLVLSWLVLVWFFFSDVALSCCQPPPPNHPCTKKARSPRLFFFGRPVRPYFVSFWRNELTRGRTGELSGAKRGTCTSASMAGAMPTMTVATCLGGEQRTKWHPAPNSFA